MALDLDIWIDRIRVYRTVPGPRIEGETTVHQSRSEWIPARLPPQEGQENPNGERPRVVQDVRGITCSLLDPNGVRLEIKKSDTIEVQQGPGPDYTDLGRWDVLGNQIPRNGVGEELLQYLQIIRREEY